MSVIEPTLTSLRRFATRLLGLAAVACSSAVAAPCSALLDREMLRLQDERPQSLCRTASVNPLFADLARRTGKAPQWNFHKYLIARDGQTVTSVASDTDPQDKAFVAAVEKMLDAK